MSDKKYASKTSLELSEKDPIENNIQSWEKEIEALSYEESIEILESILINLQDDNISLNNIQKNYVKGNILLKHCQHLLETVEQEINEISLEKLNFD
mgnify:CR=1 FL=1